MLGATLRCGLGGTVLGLATLATFAFVGVPVVPTGPAATLLTATDLPPGFSREAALPGPVVARGCAGLFADPAAGWSGAVQRGYRQQGTGTRVWEAVAPPDGDPLGNLRSRLVACGIPVSDRPGGYIAEAGDAFLAVAHARGLVLVLRYAGPARGRDAVVRAALRKLS